MAFLYETMHSGVVLETLHKEIKAKYPERLNVSEFCLLNRKRIDMLSLDYMGGKVRGYEIKVSRQDFQNDNKWREYLGYCDYFYFVCPADMIKPEELEPNIGLIYIDKGHVQNKYPGDEVVTTGQKCYRSRIVKNPKKLERVEDNLYNYICKRLVFRLMDLQKVSGSPYPGQYEEDLGKGILNINGR